jgi:hypothetical protein
MEQPEEQKLGRERIYVVGARKGTGRMRGAKVVPSHTTAGEFPEIGLASGAGFWCS